MEEDQRELAVGDGLDGLQLVGQRVVVVVSVDQVGVAGSHAREHLEAGAAMQLSNRGSLDEIGQGRRGRRVDARDPPVA